MIDHDALALGPAQGMIMKDGENWTLVLVRDLNHGPSKVWQALIDPEQLRQWSPFDADKSLGTAGARVTLTTVGAPASMVSETIVVRADAPRVLQYNWGDREVRWELEARGEGTRLTLWAGIDRRYIAMGAAGWHVCLGVLDRYLGGMPVGRLVAGDALKSPVWQRLHTEYTALFRAE